MVGQSCLEHSPGEKFETGKPVGWQKRNDRNETGTMVSVTNVPCERGRINEWLRLFVSMVEQISCFALPRPRAKLFLRVFKSFGLPEARSKFFSNAILRFLIFTSRKTTQGSLRYKLEKSQAPRISPRRNISPNISLYKFPPDLYRRASSISHTIYVPPPRCVSSSIYNS